jgi:hypothetical protein
MLASLCLLAVWIAAPLLSVAHVALDEHTYCAEHERLEEGANAHSEPPSEQDSTASVFSSREPGESPDEHEACAFGEDFTRETWTLSHDFVVTPMLAVERAPALVAFDLVKTTPLLLVAPKNSPPILV